LAGDEFGDLQGNAKVGAGDQWDNGTLSDFRGNAWSSLDAFRRR
jgi:hypothetical protein